MEWVEFGGNEFIIIIIIFILASSKRRVANVRFYFLFDS